MILVTGASSSPGFKILERLRREGWEVLGIYNQHPVEGAVQWDLAKDPVGVLERFSPDAVVHAAALGDVDRCEVEPALCYRVNAVTTREIARWCSKRGAALVYLSTDYVFPGDRGSYREEDPPRPVNYYGLTKLLGEEAALAAGGAVVRVAWIYGFGPGRQNFGRTVVEKLSRGEEVRAVVDQWGSPTLNTLIAEVVAKVLEKSISGILHAAGPRLSRYEFALAIAEAFGFSKELVKPIKAADLSFKAPRPRDSSLDSSLAVSTLGVPVNDIRYALSIFKKEWEEGRHADGRG
ncbi:dTDP-4-dehydrorhamnose reductase [Pyrobaculum ferrireducens]|uniref:dTDP-4-dehydrorhamnose reductase n=1 Tax=Pyrobaculum ferrireducens TaxID=1104324 RepID=G7VHZ9_9CREN|nr:dTDP-4-dehydrorhamnose reductase [Pyrobaculum ferrireducens]AET33359.1 dTDP-4-dehydrorhamnose reductase [Pyrobaculum ferrireducens]